MTTNERRQPTLAIIALTSTIVVADVLIFLAHLGAPGHVGEGAPLALAVLTVLLVASEYLFVSFRYGGQIDTWNLMEAALAPMIFGFGGPTVMVSVALAQIVGGLLRRNAPLKLAFNVAQWALAAGVGSAAHRALSDGHTLPDAGLTMVAALAAVAVVNQVAMTSVLSIVQSMSPLRVLRRRRGELVPGAAIGWTSNVLLGLLFVFALDADAAAVLLFPVPLIALHIANRAAANVQIERHRQQGVHDSVRILATPLNPSEAVGPFVEAVRDAFEADIACFATVGPDNEAPVVHATSATEASSVLAQLVLARDGSGRASAGDGSPVGGALAESGWRSCYYSVSGDDHGRVAIAIVDQNGLGSDDRRELVLLTGLTREALRITVKGRLIRELDDERRAYASIVSATSDGIATIGPDGVVRSWNPAFERLAALDASQVVGTRGVFLRLQARTLRGVAVDVDRWARGGRLPRELRITTTDGEPRRLTCAFSRAVDDKTGDTVLVVVARDVTATEEMEALREQFTRLVEATPLRRLERQWPSRLLPVASVRCTEIAVDHVDTARIRGGLDPYDWYILPDGDVHFAAIALATHDAARLEQAIGAIERLRTYGDEGASFDELAAVAEELFQREGPAPAVATIGRYMPDDGRVELAGVGGPNVMVVTPHDGVHELALGAGAVIDLDLALGESIVISTLPSRPGRPGRPGRRTGGERPIVDRLDRLAHLPARDLVASVLGMPTTSDRPESLVLALRRTGSESTRSWRVPPSVEAVTIFRREIVRWLRAQGIATERLDDVAIVVSELLTNAVDAARTSVELHALLDVPTLELAVSDDGDGFEVGLDEVPDVDDVFAESGRGLHIVDALASTWTVRAGDDGATVRAQLCVGDAPPAMVPTDVVHPTACDLSEPSSP